MHGSWRNALREGAITGSIASVASALALAWAGRRENGDAAAPVNAVSHWVWGRKALREDGTSARHTLAGYAVHHAASVFWGVAAAWTSSRSVAAARPLPALAGGLATSALACFVDLRMTPERLTPGFEHRLSPRSLAVVYCSFGIALGLAGYAVRRRRRLDAESCEGGR